MTENKTERQLKHSGGETPNLRGVIGDRDPEEVDVFGYQIIYTTGEFTVPREDLLAEMDDLGLPEWMAPSKVAPHRAFGRMVKDLVDDGEEVQFEGHRVRFDVDSGDSRYQQHVHAKVWHSAEDDDVNATAGKWVDHELGVISYDSDTSGLTYIDRVEDSSPLAPLWFDGIKSRASDRFERHQELHNGADVNNMVYYLARQWTDAVKLRDSCYFVPAAYEDIEVYIDGFRQLYQWLNAEHKHRGQETELFAIEIVDSERQAEMVERKVRGEIESEVSDVFDSVVESVQDGAAAEAVAEQVVSDLSDVEGLAERHSAVLKTELSVKRAMEGIMQEMDSDRERVVQKALDEAGLSPGVEA